MSIRAIIVENEKDVGEIDLKLTPEGKIPLSIKTRVGGFTYRLSQGMEVDGEFKLIYKVEFKDDEVIYERTANTDDMG